jgi:hypothetical protein
MQHISMVVKCANLLAAAQWRLVDAELDASMELDATAWMSSTSAARSVSPGGRREVKSPMFGVGN